MAHVADPSRVFDPAKHQLVITRRGADDLRAALSGLYEGAPFAEIHDVVHRMVASATPSGGRPSVRGYVQFVVAEPAEPGMPRLVLHLCWGVDHSGYPKTSESKKRLVFFEHARRAALSTIEVVNAPPEERVVRRPAVSPTEEWSLRPRVKETLDVLLSLTAHERLNLFARFCPACGETAAKCECFLFTKGESSGQDG